VGRFVALWWTSHGTRPNQRRPDHGIPIGETVDKLMQLAAGPRHAHHRTDALKSEQVAITELSALLTALQYTTDNLGKDSVSTR